MKGIYRLKAGGIPLASHTALLVMVAVVQLFFTGRGLALDPARSLFQFNCRNWSRQNGLPADAINSVTQTKDGFLWLGTQNGLVRYDGLDFKVVPIDLPSAQGQDIKHLSTFRDGNLRFAINNGGFGSYDGQRLLPVGDERWWRPGLAANTIMEARDGTVWTGADLGLGCWTPTNPAAAFFLDYTSVGSVYALCEDGAGRIWIGTSQSGLEYWMGGKLVAVPDESLKNHGLSALAADAANRIWVGTESGLRCYANGQVSVFSSFGWAVKALLVDRHGILWVGTSGMGLARYENGKFDFLTKADGLVGDYVTSLFEDAEGSLWVGARDGVSQLSDLKLPTYSANEGILKGSCQSVAAAQNGWLWIGTDSGLSCFNGATATNYPLDSLRNHYIKLCFAARNGDVYFEDGDKILSLLSGGRLVAQVTNLNWVSALAEDAESVLAAMGTGDSLFRIRNGQFVPYQYPAGEKPNYYWINNLCVAHDNSIWVACKNGVYRLQKGQVSHWSTAEGLSSPIALWISEDADQSIWVGMATGIARIKNGQIKNIQSADGLADDWIYAIVPDDLGYFWFSSSSGIFRVSRKNLNEFADGKAARIECELFNGPEAVKSIGISGQEYSGCKTSDGRIWFPGNWGVVMVDPAHLPTNQVAPPVRIEHVVANGREYPPTDSIIVPPGPGELEFQFAGLTFIAPQKAQFRYQLVGFDRDWVTKKSRREALYTNLKPGRYRFRVMAANADGVWNETGDALNIELRPRYYQTAWFDFLCWLLACAGLTGIYRWRVSHFHRQRRSLQQQQALLESKVAERTASLTREIEQRVQAQKELENRKAELEREIAERERMQREVERVHQRLLDISRQAGMAEVATNVLHNVGNVLNSVNVTATLLAENAKNSKAPFLAKVAALLNEHAADLDAFVTADPKGQKVLEYLSHLAGQLAGEQQAAIKDLDQLRQHIDHIKEIVAMQQDYARVSGVTEIVQLPELVEDALSMSAQSLARHQVEVVREYAELPPLLVEKHKVLQILVNLIRNAKQACDEAQPHHRQIRIKISRVDGWVEIGVMDNGVGIPPENLTRIFGHGFTTRKGGHGYGLHGSALAAAELKGTLTAHSEGPGRGAAFILRLPLPDP